MGETEKKTDISGLNDRAETFQAQEAPEGLFSDETIGSLMEKCEELTQEIYSEEDRLERFMLETGGSSDASDRIQDNIDSLREMLAEAEKHLQVLSDAQEEEAFAPEKKAMDGHKNTGRASVKKKLAEKKAEVAMGKTHKKENERKSPGLGMEK